MPRCAVCQLEVSADHERCPGCTTLLPNAAEAAFEKELRLLLQEGRKLDAIKLYRQRTGVSLGEAKDVVDALESGAALPKQNRLDPNLEQDLLVLLERGKKIEAIKVYRDATGVGLKEAKDAVEALIKEYRISPVRTGCFGAALLMILAVVLPRFF